MVIVIAFILLGLGLGVRLESRLGAMFLGLAAVTCTHLILDGAPRILAQSAYGRRVAATFHALSVGGGASLVNTALALVAGLMIAALLRTLSEDEHARKWDPDARNRRRLHARGRRAHWAG